jgi:hypothetical protein
LKKPFKKDLTEWFKWKTTPEFKPHSCQKNPKKPKKKTPLKHAPKEYAIKKKKTNTVAISIQKCTRELCTNGSHM